MVRTVISLYLLGMFSIACAQKLEPNIIYIQFKKRSDCSEILKFYHNEEKGVVFNFYCTRGESFIYRKGSDTLPISELKNYKFSTPTEIEVLEKQWRKKNKKALIKKYGKLYPPFDKNGIFQANLIEIINDQQFVIYPVEWRNLDVIAN